MRIKLDKGAYMPERAHENDAGYDLRSPVKITAYKRGYAIIDTGVHVEIPKGMVGMLKSKSGLNVKYGLVSEGVIDSGYTGSLVVKLYNHSDENFYINAGNKISQLVIVPCHTPELELVDELEETERGNNGFGSTGR